MTQGTSSPPSLLTSWPLALASSLGLSVLLASPSEARAQAEAEPQAQTGEAGPPSAPPPPAQQGPAPQPEPPPQGAYGYPPPGAPPGYQYPGTPQYPGAPPAGSYPQGYSGSYYPPPPPHGNHRQITLALAAGPGSLRGPGEEAFGVSYDLRLGFGVARDTSLVVAYGGVGADSVSPETGRDSWLWQHLWFIGAEQHFARFLYARGGVGLASVGEDLEFDTVTGGHGFGMSAALGLELLQGDHLALGLEFAATAARYRREWWGMGGVHLVLAFF